MLKKLRDIRKQLAKVKAAKAKIAAAKSSISKAKAELGKVKEARLNAQTKIAKVRRTVKGVKTGALIAGCVAVAGAVAFAVKNRAAMKEEWENVKKDLSVDLYKTNIEGVYAVDNDKDGKIDAYAIDAQFFLIGLVKIKAYLLYFGQNHEDIGIHAFC